MKRMGLHQSSHLFDALPFEVFSSGSWKAVLYLKINGGIVSTQVVDEGDVIEENVQISKLRIRSRKATLSDCICFLRPGLDICVLPTPQESENSCENENFKSGWLDAKIKTIERKRHESGCDCQFYVLFYNTQKKNTIAVQLEQISILQKLTRNPCENKFFRWEFSEDCTSLEQSKLFPGKFSSDLSWAVVASLHKKLNFDIRLMQRKIIYRISNYDYNENIRNSRDEVVSLNFKVENEISVPVVFAFTLSDVVGKEISNYSNENGNGSIYYLLGLRRSKRKNIEPDRYVDCDIFGSYFNKSHKGKYKKCDYREYWDDYVYDLEKQPENHERGEHSRRESIFENFEEIQTLDDRIEQPQKLVSMFDETDEIILNDLEKARNYFEDNVFEKNSESQIRTRSQEKSIEHNPNEKNYTTQKSKLGHVDEIPQVDEINAKKYMKSKRMYKSFQTKRHYSINSKIGAFRRTGTSGYRSIGAGIFKKIMEKCVENINSTIGIEQPLAIDQWNEIKAASSLNRCDRSDSSQSEEEEKLEIDLLWNEMDLCIASTNILDDNKGSDAEVSQRKNDGGGQVCEHEFKIDEEIGILCRLCGHVETEIKDVSPKFMERSKLIYSRGEFYKGDFEHNQNEYSWTDLLSLNSVSNTPLSEGEHNVWALIPDLRNKLRFHQKKAFEFLWRNIAGSLIPHHMQEMAKERGGCVISHSPGAGKTLLVIAFLESYLKLFPRSRPLVLAPKTTLYAWYKEIKKWDISIPVYRIHSARNSKGEDLRVSQKSPKPHRDYFHILDCMEKIQKWVSNPSVLIMGYPSFLTLTRGNTNCSYKQYMARILKQSPGILILDEGHNPRATRSGLRKALMRVETKLRVLLSGTLFQNNFGEYFNTLALARPNFVDEVLMELDPDSKRRKRNAGPVTRLLMENRARRLFNDGIAKKINAESADERTKGLNMLRKLTSGFIHVYEGGSDNLPGLHCYTLMMKSTPLQQELLVKLQNQKPRHSGFPLELEALITLGSIHPCLIQTALYATQYFTSKELETLEKYKSTYKLGPKVRFVMSLLPRCIIKNEKVLIFCFNIAPIKLFIEIFESIFGWKKGDDVLVITGDLELFERGRIMDKFEENGTNVKVMLASITACGEGVSLTAASRLILLDSQWNPSKTKQAIARAFRPGQKKNVFVYQLLASGTLEEDKYVKTTWKEWVSSMIFSNEIAEGTSKMKAEKIEDDVLREIVEEDGASLFNMILKNNEKASNGVVKSK